LWEANNLLGADLCSYNDGTAASTEYQALSGCTTAIPVETEGSAGTACGHWSETCYQGELMTGFATDGLEISRSTVGTLEDMGYVVDYCQADAFPVSLLDPSCVCSSIQADDSSGAGINEDSKGRRRRRKLSDDGNKIAVEYGRQYLKNKRIKREHMTKHEGVIDLEYVIILYLEEGEIHDVHVTSHDM
jgi:hypothetical protein